MARRSRLVVLLAAALAAAPPATAQRPPRAIAPLSHDVTAFVDVTIVPMDSARTIVHRTVIVRDGRIVMIGAADSTPVPTGARRIDGRGQYLLPGLADMHVHLRYLRKAGDNPWMLRAFVAGGVTTVLNLLGLPEHLALRDSLDRGALLGPTLFTSGFYVNEPYVKTPEQVDSAVTVQKRDGYDVVKLHGNLSRDAYHQLFLSARREGLRVVGHAPRALGLTPMLDERQDAVAHAEEYLYAYFFYGRRSPIPPDSVLPMLTSVATATRAAGTWLIPTLAVFRGIATQAESLSVVLARPEAETVPEGIRADWLPAANPYAKLTPPAVSSMRSQYRLLTMLVKAMRDAGVPMLAGTDTPVPSMVPGASLHDELDEMVGAGLTPYEALRAATIDAATFLGVPGEFGEIRVGARADLLLLPDDPLLDISATTRRTGVMARGRWFDAEALAALIR